jgi:hypothetical protein
VTRFPLVCVLLGAAAACSDQSGPRVRETAAVSGMPAAVSGGHRFAALAGGGGFMCAATGDGQPWCWGETLTRHLLRDSVPTVVASAPALTTISAGTLHACGFGSGDSVNHTTPVPVAGGLTFSSVSVGLAHTCGVAAAGKAYCWGFNAAGALGDGTQADTTIPAAVAGGIAFTSVAETCGLTSSGVAYCWGPNDKGQIGDPSATLDDCTLGTALCALTPVLVSGGQLGDGTTADSPLPQIVSGVIAP